MDIKMMRNSARTLVSASIVVLVTIVALIFVANLNTSNAAGDRSVSLDKAVSPSVPAAIFPGTGVGAIPDSATGPQVPGTPLNITFAVTGIASAPSNVEVSMTATHTWVGDLKATLIAPNGASFTVFGYTGATSATSFGSSSDLSGTYNFKDSAAGTNWWTAAAATPVPIGDYRTTVSGPVASPAGVTNLTAAFAAIPTSNGTWTLRITDGGAGDTGSVSAANLTLTASTPTAKKPLDFNGDGKTDYSVVRNTGGGPSGQVSWYNCYTGVGEPACWQFLNFGIASDFFVPADYDGDGKADIAIWRPGVQGQYIILNSSTQTVSVDNFGQTGDDPSVIADYTGDGKADPAVYRDGLNPGDKSFWYYRASSGPYTGVIVFEQWGQKGDFVAPGDYDGDGKADFMIQRDTGAGQAIFWRRINGSNAVSNTVFGLISDQIVPGDYDGDGKTDIAVVRGSGGSLYWFYQSSLTNALVYGGPFGLSATDYTVQGDYDGDGKTDIAVWRPSADYTANYFYILGSTSGFRFQEWGQNGDFPTANYNTH